MERATFETSNKFSNKGQATMQSTDARSPSLDGSDVVLEFSGALAEGVLLQPGPFRD